jgi:hypothetical protein
MTFSKRMLEIMTYQIDYRIDKNGTALASFALSSELRDVFAWWIIGVKQN